jgi:hypothetical protein
LVFPGSQLKERRGKNSVTKDTNIRVVGDFEFFIDSLLSHAEEDNCTHSVMDLLAEYYANKNKNRGVGRPAKASNTNKDSSAADNNETPSDQQGVSLL